MTKADFKQDVFNFLDGLRNSGKMNMFGAPTILQENYGLNRQDAMSIWKEWTEKFNENGTVV